MMPVFRTEIQENDTLQVQEICRSTGFFRDDEISVAMELVTEALEQGSASSGYYFIFATENGKVCGFACFGPTPCTIGSYDLYWIVVHNDFRGKGIGLQLLERAEDDLKRLKARKLYIETSVTEKYEPTRRFYQKAGYRSEAILEDFYMPGDHKIIYVKTFS